MRAGDPNKYDGLQMSEIAYNLLTKHNKLFTSLCNGVGSTTGTFNKLFYYCVPSFIRNRIYLLNVTPCSDIHDVEYSFPRKFYSEEHAIHWKEVADMRFRDNLYILIRNQKSWKWLERLRLSRASKYYRILRVAGDKAFLDNKLILTRGDYE